MSKFLKITLATAALAAFSSFAHAEGDAEAGKKVFNKCKACHAVGEGAKNKVGPALNDLFGRTAEQRREFRKRILQVTLEDLKRVSAQYLQPELASTAIITSQNAYEELGDYPAQHGFSDINL